MRPGSSRQPRPRLLFTEQLKSPRPPRAVARAGTIKSKPAGGLHTVGAGGDPDPHLGG